MISEGGIQKSRFRFKTAPVNVSSFFQSLCIEFRRVKGQTFWEANVAMLPELYRELQVEARGKLRELHPDTGGNAEEFDAFIQSLTRVKRAFAREMISLPETNNGTLRVRPVKDQRRAMQARIRRQRDPEKYRAYRRDFYHRQKAEGTLPKRKYKPAASSEARLRRSESKKKYRKKNVTKIRQWKRNFYWRNRDRLNQNRKKYVRMRDIPFTEAWKNRRAWRIQYDLDKKQAA